MSKEFGIRLYYLRTHKTGCTQYQVARHLHIDRSTYTYYECGKTEPSVKTLWELARFFGVSCDELLDPRISENELADYEIFKSNRKQKARE